MVFKRVFSGLSAFALLFFLSVPVFATGTEIGPYTGGVPVGLDVRLDVVDLFTYLDGRWDRVVDGATGFAKFAYSLIDEDVCSHAPQVGGTHNFVPRRTTKDGQIGLYYVCEYCGKAYGDALEEAYQDYVETLPGTQYNSDGAFVWAPSWDDFQTARIEVFSGVSASINPSVYLSASVPTASKGFWSSGYNPTYTATANLCESVSCVVTKNYPANDIRQTFFRVNWGNIIAPVSGYYTIPGSYFPSTSGSGYTIVHAYYSADSVISLRYSNLVYVSSDSGSCAVLWPSFRVEVSDSSGSEASSVFSVNTRASVDNSGLYGYVQDGQLYQSTVGNIYSETTNVYQNPVTGDTHNISSWQYDYSDRSYTLTTDEGDAITVAYGDSNVTINEGGTTYNVYYLMEETEELQEEIESRCDHDYASTVTTVPTCTASGVRTYTCSECGSSYTETIPATGHDYQSAVTMEPTCVSTGVTTFACSRCGSSYTQTIPATGHIWEVVRSIPTQYDDTGQLIQTGYTLYQCSTCGEQYKITSDSGGDALPVPSSGGASTGGAALVGSESDVGEGFLALIAGGLSHDLPAVLQMMSDWFTLVPQMFSGYTAFLAAGFAWLPSDCLMLLSFGVGSVVFIGIVKAIRRR